LLNKELERIWKEVVIALPRFHPDIGLEGPRKTSKISWLMSVFTRILRFYNQRFVKNMAEEDILGKYKDVTIKMVGKSDDV
jgi:hypothetical protein